MMNLLKQKIRIAFFIFSLQNKREMITDTFSILGFGSWVMYPKFIDGVYDVPKD